MKAIQVTLDDDLLRDLDASDEAKRDGRSAVIRRATAAYLRRQRQAAITAQYARAYGSGGGAFPSEFDGWEDEGEWPTD